MIPDEWLRQLQVMMNATRWSTVLMLMLQVMVKTWEWQFVNTMEATMKQVLKRCEFLWTNDSDYFAGIVG